MGCRTFGLADRIRVPLPAARMTMWMEFTDVDLIGRSACQAVALVADGVVDIFGRQPEFLRYKAGSLSFGPRVVFGQQA